ncbi:MAG: dockerin type I repeat-containing protein [Armatimonadota bacterium]
MRTQVLVFMTVLLLCAACAYGAQSVLYGDMNGDARLDVMDVGLAFRAALGLREFPQEIMRSADVAPRRSTDAFGDGRVDVSDVLRLLRYVLGLEGDPWPAREVLFPVETGNWWSYADGNGSVVTAEVGPRVQIEVVDHYEDAYEVKLSNGESYWMRQDGGEDGPVLKLLRKTERNGVTSTFVPAVELVRHPLYVGKVWSGRTAVPIGMPSEGEFVSEVVREETVSTEAGTFRTYQVKTQVAIKVGPWQVGFTLYSRYAPWFGWVTLSDSADRDELRVTSANVHGVRYP